MRKTYLLAVLVLLWGIGGAQVSVVGAGSSSTPTTLDCSTYSGATAVAQLQACFSALNTLNNQSGVADARKMIGMTWTSNPFSGATMPKEGVLLMPPGTVTTNVPIVLAQYWKMEGIHETEASKLQASSTFPTSYSTGTVTVGTQGANDVITGSGTNWTTSGLVPGCAFVAAPNFPNANDTYGIIKSINSDTSLTLAYGVNGYGGAPGAGSSYMAFCPVLVHGDGGNTGQQGYEYATDTEWMAFDANNRTGVVPELSWFGTHPTTGTHNVEDNFCGIGLLVEGNQSQNSSWVDVAAHPGTCGTANSIGIMLAVNDGLGPVGYLAADKGASSVNPTVGVEIETNGIVVNNVRSDNVTYGVAINDGATCVPACAWGNAFGNGTPNDIEVNGVTGSGTTAVYIKNTSTEPPDVTIRDVQNSGGAWTNMLYDVGHSLTLSASTEGHLGAYLLDAKGNVGFTTARAALSSTQSGTAGTATCYETPQGNLKTVSCYLNAYQETGSAQTWTFPLAFSTTPVLQESGGSCGTYNPSVSSTVLTLPANAAMTAETCTVMVSGQ